MKYHSRSIYGCTQAPKEFTAPQDCRLTYNPETKRLYVHVFAWPFRYLPISGLAGRIEYAQLLNDASEIHFFEGTAEYLAHWGGLSQGTVILELPVKKPNVTVPVIELYLK